MHLPKRFISHLVGTAAFSLSLMWGHPLKAESKISIAVIPMGTSHVYWKAVEAGARKAANELGMTWLGRGL
jgi:ABC-type sugar transport system substrate-binding protein